MDAPVADGQVIYPDILGTGVDVVASRELDEEAPDRDKRNGDKAGT